MITGKILKYHQWPDRLIRFAKHAAERLEALGLERAEVLAQLDAVRTQPDAYLTHPILAELAQECAYVFAPERVAPTETLRDQPVPYPVWGRDQIDASALAQMDAAMRLPVSVAGALMPDAHVGYGLPIGGVLATREVIIPFAVGVDIACRMRMSVYDISPHVLGQKPGQFEKALLEQTRFGMGAKWEANKRPDHPVLSDPDWNATGLLRSLKEKAYAQLGTSGTGNHFVEWGIFKLRENDSALNLPPGDYLALLSHSGSRAVGFKIADHYSKLAQEQHPNLDKSVRHLAWLSLDAEAGQEYWTSMELAGRFASANHSVIHQRVAAAVGLKEVAHVENHHNFCIPGDALVPTLGGPKYMREICPGDQVYAFDPDLGLTPTKVAQHWCSGVKGLITLRTYNRTLRASADHPILTVQREPLAHPSPRQRRVTYGVLRWKKLSEIQAGELMVCAEGYYPPSNTMGENRARLLGAFLGDGWIRHDTTHGRYTVGLAIGKASEAHTAKYKEILETELPPANWAVDAPGAYGLTCASAKVWRTIVQWGVAHCSLEKSVPDLIFTLPLREKLAFLAGYVDADGSVANTHTSNHGRATLASTNRKLVEGMREVAISCGLRITAIRRENIHSNFGDTIVYRCVLSADSTHQLPLWHETKAAHQTRTRHHRPQGLSEKGIGYLKLPAGTFVQRVISVNQSELEQPVYDLTVEHASHSFVVEGIVVHNCWREQLENGREVFIHRKGATPAGPGVLGLIPGSMGDAGFVVRGKGEATSLHSASHGAGRAMSRKAAFNNITKPMRDAYLRERGITLLGGGLDEAPQAYKSVEAVIAAQSDLIDILGRFAPKIVRMAEEAGEY